MIGGGLPGWTPPAWAARADARRRARAAPAAARRRRAGGTATRCTRTDPRGGRARRSCSSSEPPVQTGSEACSPVPVSGAWSPCAASAIHGLQAPPRARTRISTSPASRARRSGRSAAPASTRLVRAPSKSAGVTVRPKPRGFGAARGERREAPERLEQRSEPGRRAERERAPAGDRRTPHRAERSLVRPGGNVCTISCATHRRKKPTAGGGVAARARSGRRSVSW